MDDIQEGQFQQIAVDAVVRAERVKCEPEVFVEGLRTMLIEVKQRYDEACEEFGVSPDYPRF